MDHGFSHGLNRPGISRLIHPLRRWSHEPEIKSFAPEVRERAVPIVRVLVHAKDVHVRQWYLNWEFESIVSDPFHLFLLLKDIKEMLGDWLKKLKFFPGD